MSKRVAQIERKLRKRGRSKDQVEVKWPQELTEAERKDPRTIKLKWPGAQEE